MNKAKCPYCDNDLDIDLDYEYGLRDCEPTTFRCWRCNKKFMIQMTCSFTANKVACLNDPALHVWHTKECNDYTYKKVCEYCGDVEYGTYLGPERPTPAAVIGAYIGSTTKLGDATKSRLRVYVDPKDSQTHKSKPRFYKVIDDIADEVLRDVLNTKTSTEDETKEA